jgi:hypothetical protein
MHATVSAILAFDFRVVLRFLVQFLYTGLCFNRFLLTAVFQIVYLPWLFPHFHDFLLLRIIHLWARQIINKLIGKRTDSWYLKENNDASCRNREVFTSIGLQTPNFRQPGGDMKFQGTD